MTILIISYIGWQFTYVFCGGIGIFASIAGLLLISEPKNSLRSTLEELNKSKSELSKEHKSSLITKILMDYASGFKSIFTNISATLCICGIFSRVWETATSSSYMTKYFTIYTTHGYTSEYSIYTSIAILIGSFASNIFSVILIGILKEENPMTIPYVCIARHVIDIPALALMFLI